MKRGTLNFAIDATTFLVMLAMIATGLLVRFVLPPGSGERRTLWEYGRHDWGDVHFLLAVTLGSLALVHVALHWGWVCSLVQSWFPRGGPGVRPSSASRRNLAGAALLVVVAGLVGGFLWMAERNVVDSGGGGQQHRRGQRAALVAPTALADEPARSTESAPTSDFIAGDGIRVFCFHRTLHCQTCLTIEALARDALQEHFADGLAAGRIAWQAVNIEQSGNEHFEQDFALQMQSLVLTEFAKGQCVRWNVTGQVESGQWWAG